MIIIETKNAPTRRTTSSLPLARRAERLVAGDCDCGCESSGNGLWIGPLMLLSLVFWGSIAYLVVRRWM